LTLDPISGGVWRTDKKRLLRVNDESAKVDDGRARASVACLAQLHGNSTLLVTPDGEMLPALFKSLDLAKVDALLGPCFDDERTFPTSSPELERLRSRDARLSNGSTYVLRGFDPDTSRLILARGRYFDTITTCFELRAELHRALVQGPESAWSRMPRRIASLGGREGDEANEWLWYGETRSASVGISCLFMVKTANGFRYCAARRGMDVPDEPGLEQVVPSMLFQPGAKKEPGDYSIRRTILREVAEELFSVPKEGDWANSAPIVRLQALMEQGRAGLRATGLALNLEDLRLEILTLLYVLDADWMDEFGPAMQAYPSEHGHGPKVWHGIDDFLTGRLPAAFRSGNGTIASTACVALGAPWVRHIAAEAPIGAIAGSPVRKSSDPWFW
jgi:hypothetical protein